MTCPTASLAFHPYSCAALAFHETIRLAGSRMIMASCARSISARELPAESSHAVTPRMSCGRADLRSSALALFDCGANPFFAARALFCETVLFAGAGLRRLLFVPCVLRDSLLLIGSHWNFNRQLLSNASFVDLRRMLAYTILFTGFADVKPLGSGFLRSASPR